MWVAFYNGYPLVTPDSGAYIRFAFDFQVLKDRSPFYSVFLALAGMRYLHTAWIPVFVQSLIVVMLLFRYSYIITARISPLYKGLIIAIIAFTTTLSLTASYIMPDVFTAILLLAALLYYIDTERRVYSIMYLCIVFMCVIIHNSNYIILPFTIICLLILSLIFKKKKFVIRSFQLLITASISIMLLFTLHFVKGFGWTTSPGSHVFLTAKFAETGVMKKYLEDSCGHKDLKLCSYKDEVPSNFSEYMWADYSPFYKIGGWDSSEAENKIVIKDIVQTPEYMQRYIGQSLKGALRQLLITGPESIYPFQEPSSPANNINAHISNESHQYRNARQYKNKLSYVVLKDINLIVFFITTICILLIFNKLQNKKRVLLVYAIIVLYIAINSLTASFFSEVTPRFNYRVFWVLPATNIILVIDYLWSRGKLLRTRRVAE